MKKYLSALLAIWANMFVGRSRKNLTALAVLAVIAILEILHVYSVLAKSGNPYLLWGSVGIAVFAWFFAFPAFVYLVDTDRRKKVVKN